MKKYVKPELFYERYELNQHIAACAYDLNYADQNTCAGHGYVGKDAYLPETWIIIGTIGVDGCQIAIEEYCYMAPSDGHNTFNS